MRAGKTVSQLCGVGLTAVFGMAAPVAAQNGGGAPFISALNFGDYILQMPACKTPDGTNVRYVMPDHDYLESPFAYRITSVTSRRERAQWQNEGLPFGKGAYIVLNKLFMATITPEARLNVLAHECAHHELNHTATVPQDYAEIEAKENQADCEAVKIMKRTYGMDDRAIRRGLEIFRDQRLGSDTAPHGTGPSRHARSIACMLK